MLLPRVVSYGPVRATRLAAACFACLTLFFLVRQFGSSYQSHPGSYAPSGTRASPWREWSNATASSRSDEAIYLAHLIQKHSLSNEIPWYARRIQTVPSGRSDRPSITSVGKSLMSRSGFARVRADDENLRLGIQGPIKLPVAKSHKINEIDGSEMLFAISTSFSRLIYADNELVRDWGRWLTDGNKKSNGAGLILTLNRASATNVATAKEILAASGIDAVVFAAEGDVATRYAELAHKLKKHSDENAAAGKRRKYLALVDDDVFFPSMAKLQQKLYRFNSDKEYYICAPSERTDWVFDNNQAFTYGGGAVFLTTPLLDKLVQQTCLKQIIRNDEAGDQWDMMLWHCVEQSGGLDLQVLPTFYDPREDFLYGDQGIILNEGYAQGLQALSLHHAQNTHRFDAGRGHLVADVCGEACFLQRFHFRDDWVLVNGYALTHYSEGVEAMPLRAKAPSPENNNQDEERRTDVSAKLVIDAPDRPEDLSVVAWRGRKKTWKFLDAAVRDNGEVWQAYVNRRSANLLPEGEYDDRQPGDIVESEEEQSKEDSVIVLVWQP